MVYSSNIFAILGLRSLYTVLANAVVDLPYLKPGALVCMTWPSVICRSTPPPAALSLCPAKSINQPTLTPHTHTQTQPPPKAVATILGLVGCKLGLEYFGYEVPNLLSLGVIASLLGMGVGASLYYKPNPDQ